MCIWACGACGIKNVHNLCAFFEKCAECFFTFNSLTIEQWSSTKKYLFIHKISFVHILALEILPFSDCTNVNLIETTFRMRHISVLFSFIVDKIVSLEIVDTGFMSFHSFPMNFSLLIVSLIIWMIEMQMSELWNIICVHLDDEQQIFVITERIDHYFLHTISSTSSFLLILHRFFFTRDFV